jgi:hypothetical protein
MQENGEQDRKIGQGHAAAMLRTGLAEIRGVFFSEAAQHAQDPGLYGVATSIEVNQARSPEVPSESVLQNRLQQAENSRDPVRDDKSMERE